MAGIACPERLERPEAPLPVQLDVVRPLRGEGLPPHALVRPRLADLEALGLADGLGRTGGRPTRTDMQAWPRKMACTFDDCPSDHILRREGENTRKPDTRLACVPVPLRPEEPPRSPNKSGRCTVASQRRSPKNLKERGVTMIRPPDHEQGWRSRLCNYSCGLRHRLRSDPTRALRRHPTAAP